MSSKKKEDVYKELYKATEGRKPTYQEEGIWLLGAWASGIYKQEEGKRKIIDLVGRALDDIDAGRLDREPTDLLKYLIGNKIIHNLY
ncbi:MAG: hypothetical protein SCARUB_04081 [Candidatus Scalindua rubra]|uniref:Uncharacterized protein n=1 Tax=Candidatus Scalindua rubra TaxID=1872076 RepID=A0A1E3X584_9BACT|nr:MAG: hypothetical protein SCARUB_04081 [Candidatus Scalindua rubra]